MERLNVDSPLDRARTQTEDPRADAEQFAAGRVRERLVNALKAREPRDRKSELPQQWEERPEPLPEGARAHALREPRLAGRRTASRILLGRRSGRGVRGRARAAAAAAAFTKTGADEVLLRAGAARRRRGPPRNAVRRRQQVTTGGSIVDCGFSLSSGSDAAARRRPVFIDRGRDHSYPGAVDGPSP